uniref:Protein SDA1 n=1 Tax=Populus trichocarpa TaxID=3694 RepID=A0A3N7FMX2_POPTR
MEVLRLSINLYSRSCLRSNFTRCYFGHSRSSLSGISSNITIVRWLILVKTLALYMELQTLGNRTLRKLAFTHVVHSIRRMNKQHKNEANNRVLQNILFSMLQMMKHERTERLLHYVNFTEERCGLIIEHHIQFVWHV